MSRRKGERGKGTRERKRERLFAYFLLVERRGELQRTKRLLVLLRKGQDELVQVQLDSRTKQPTWAKTLSSFLETTVRVSGKGECVPYGGEPQRSFNNRSCPLYLNTVAKPKSDTFKFPVSSYLYVSSVSDTAYWMMIMGKGRRTVTIE